MPETGDYRERSELVGVKFHFGAYPSILICYAPGFLEFRGIFLKFYLLRPAENQVMG